MPIRSRSGKLATVLAVGIVLLLTCAFEPSVLAVSNPRRTTGIVAFVDPSASSPAAFGQDVLGTSDGGYLVVGSIGQDQHDGWVGKVAASGRLQWQRQIGCGASNLTSVAQVADGGYVLAGAAEGCDSTCVRGAFHNLGCAWVVKLSAAGTLEWQQNFFGTLQATAARVYPTADGGYVVAGSTSDRSSTSFAWVARLDTHGNALWQRQIGATSFASAQAVQQTADGGYIVGGSTGYIGSSRALIIKLDAAGGVQWQKEYGPGYEEFAKSIVQTSDGGYVVAGTDAGETGRYNAFLMRLSPSGRVLWEKRYDGQGRCNATACFDGESDARAVVPTADGGYVLAGYAGFHLVHPSVPASTSWLVKTDSRGNIVWQKVFYQVNSGTGLPYSGAFYGLDRTSDGGFVAVGYNDRYHNSDNVWVVRTDADGEVSGCSADHPSLLDTLNATFSITAGVLPVKSISTAGAPATGPTRAGTLAIRSVC